MIVSFAWTTPALLAGAKTMTRRDWKDDHALKFQRGTLVDAWDRSPRTKLGRKVAIIRVTRSPYGLWSTDLPPDHIEREGFNWLSAHGEAIQVLQVRESWRMHERRLWVLEFEIVDRICRCGATIGQGGGIVGDNITKTHEEDSRQEWRCCVHCAFNPLGCRCRFGEVGFAETGISE